MNSSSSSCRPCTETSGWPRRRRRPVRVLVARLVLGDELRLLGLALLEVVGGRELTLLLRFREFLRVDHAELLLLDVAPELLAQFVFLLRPEFEHQDRLHRGGQHFAVAAEDAVQGRSEEERSGRLVPVLNPSPHVPVEQLLHK